MPVITSGDPSVKAEPAGQHYLDVLDTLYYTPGTTRARLDISTDLYWDVTDMNYGLDWENLSVSIQNITGYGDKTIELILHGNPDSRNRLDSLLISGYETVDGADVVVSKKILVVRTKQALAPPADGLSWEHKEFNCLGYGYDVTQEYMSPEFELNQIVDVSEINRRYPDRIHVNNSPFAENKMIVGETGADYCKKITSSVRLGGLALFGGTLNNKFGSDYSYSAKYGFGSYDMNICLSRVEINFPPDSLKRYLSDAFRADVNNADPEYIIQKYGTHVLTNIYLGGRLQIMYRSFASSFKRTTIIEAGMGFSIQKIFSQNIGSTTEETLASQNKEQVIAYKTIGGDVTRSLFGKIDLGSSDPVTVDISNWQASCNLDNAVLTDVYPGSLVPIYEVVENPKRRADLKIAVERYLNDHAFRSLGYKTPVYRYHSGDNRHFLTPDETEIVNGTYDDWLESPPVRFYIYSSTAQPSGTVPLYRYLSTETYTPRYFYTVDKDELSYGQYGFYMDKMIGYVFSPDNVPSDPKAVPLYKCATWSGDVARRYFYTTDSGEIASARRNGFYEEGIACYVFPRGE